MVRKGSTVRFRKGAPGACVAGPAWRSSSVGKSTRLIIVGSRVRVPPPLPAPETPPGPSHHPTNPTESLNGQGEVRAQQAALEHWDDRSYRPWEDDVDGGDHEGVARSQPDHVVHAV